MTLPMTLIAEITGKPHNEVMEAIRKMEEAWTRVN
jgi:hypothetical protein